MFIPGTPEGLKCGNSSLPDPPRMDNLMKDHSQAMPLGTRYTVHLGIDADTLEMRSIEITGSRVGDAPVAARGRLRCLPARKYARHGWR